MSTEFIVNHLWQSSCFVLLAALLAFALRSHSPKICYWVWLSESLKFLIPFALLVSFGNEVPRPTSHSVSATDPVFSTTLVQIAEPVFARSPSRYSGTRSDALDADRNRRCVGTRRSYNRTGAMPRLVEGSRSTSRQHARRNPDSRTGGHHARRGGTGYLWFLALGFGSAGATPGASEPSTAWRHPHA